MKSKKKSLFHYVTVKLSVVTSNCEVHLLSVSQSLIGLQKHEVLKRLSVILVRLWASNNPAQLNSRSTAALAGKATFIHKNSSFSCGQAAILAVLSSVECKYCSRQLCDECFLDLRK